MQEQDWAELTAQAREAERARREKEDAALRRDEVQGVMLGTLRDILEQLRLMREEAAVREARAAEQRGRKK